MTLTEQQIKRIMPYATTANIQKYLPHLNELMPRYEINTPLRAAHFIAQLAHECGSFRYVEEIASGAAYEGRADLGNVKPGDGVKFKGRGLIQLTGRTNYTKFSDYTGHDFINRPADLTQPNFAVESACWFWKTRGLNELADKDDVRAVTKRINGGYNGLADRESYLVRAKCEII